MKNFQEKVRAYALKNAIAYKGKAQQGAVISSLFNEGLDKKDLKKHISKISEEIKKVNSLSQEEQKKEFEKLESSVSKRKVREGLPELPNVKKSGVIMRFAPSASGPLHIGHAATSCISFLYVKKYGGKFYVRIEDTNPENIYVPAYKRIEQESKWLFDNIAKVIIQSERMEIYYKYMKKLLEKNLAYVCTCTGDKFREYSQNKKSCPCRNLSQTEQKQRWKKMLDKNGFKEGEAVLRFKSDMKHSNPAMRDFPLARINTTQHPLQKNKYRVWPLMNLAVAVDDIEMKMTHIIRGKDHRDNALRQQMIYQALGKEKQIPWTAFLGRIKFKDLELSTTKFRQGIESGKYSGWDDEKLPTIASLKKQGFKPEAFWKFAEQVGLSESDKVIEKKEYLTLLKAFNKDKNLFILGKSNKNI
jgi:glutamyl-tRNA synthetase